MAMQFTTLVGRMVYGSVWDLRKKTDKKGNPVLVKSGPNAGKQRESCDFGVAFAKVLVNGQPNVQFDEFRRNVIEQARATYPQFFAGPVDPFTGKAGASHPRMSLKISDGDGVDGEGKPNNTKEGWAGHWVVHFSSSNKPRVFDIRIGLAPEQQLQDSSRCLPGDYVAVQGNCEGNEGSETPGVYMNHSMVCLVEGGQRIVTGPKAADAFAGIAGAPLPPGAVAGATPANMPPPVPGAVPSVPAVPAVPTVPVVPHDPFAKAVADGWIAHPSAPGYFYKGSDVKLQADVIALYPAAPAVPVAPTPPAVPAVPAVPTPPAVPVGKQLTPAAMQAGFTSYEQATANGWTDDLLRQHGYLA